ncbi:hypothetical protein [Pontibacter pudoricolor]|uniref:hypothetical protein n=1 Tax=Pontibacter pudoricolor TaxID=2694930 RepID=UPI001391ACC7|nr:hypothetical protein [Pontibacter pudoricolor]
MPAEGEGRDSVYAVATGWQEQAFTVRRALRKPYNWPMKHKVKMNYILYAAETYNSETERFDALALIYAHFPPATRHH